MFSRKNKPFKLLSQGPGRLSETTITTETNKSWEPIQPKEYEIQPLKLDWQDLAPENKP